jgi:hypothetical protein
MQALRPYENEAQTEQIGNLTVENRLDRVTLAGDVDLTRDRRGLAQARRLAGLLDAVIAALEAVGEQLPEALPRPATGEAPNPFA